MTKSRYQVAIAAVLLAAAVTLHSYEHFVKVEGEPSIMFFLWALLPYIVCLFVFLLSDSGAPAIAGAIVALALDAAAFDTVFVHPTTSTSALALLFIPLWSTIVFVPLTVFGTKFVIRRLQSRN